MNDLRIKENELFERWRKHSTDEETFFVQDGTLDPEEYVKAKIKICSILKEVPFDTTANKGYLFGDGFLKRLHEKGPNEYQNKKGTLSILSKRINLIRGIIEQNQNGNAIDQLRESAYVNIKKYRGTKTSSQKDLEKIAINDKAFLLEQIEELLQPDILLCGKTRHYLSYLYGGDIEFLMEDESKKVKLFHLLYNGSPKKLIIEMYHPSHRGSEVELLSKLESLLVKYQSSKFNIFKK